MYGVSRDRLRTGCDMYVFFVFTNFVVLCYVGNVKNWAVSETGRTRCKQYVRMDT